VIDIILEKNPSVTYKPIYPVNTNELIQCRRN